MTNILVIGGAGFIGINLCKRLLSQGHYVACYDNLYSSIVAGDEKLKLKILEDLQKEWGSQFEHVNADVRYFGTDDLIFFEKEEPFDQVYLLACPASPVTYQKDPIYTTMTSILGTYEALETIGSSCKILLTSTSEVYGDPLEHPQRETYRGNVSPIGPRACYDESKRCAESLMVDYHRKYKTKIKLVRLFNSYGPYLSVGDGRVISNFIVQALRNEPITIYGDGTQTRSFCYIDDTVRGIISMMESSDDIIGPVNIGNPIEYTVNHIARTIIKLTSSKSELVFRPLPQDDPCKRNPDIGLARSILGWEPIEELETGLGKTIRYFEEVLNAGGENLSAGE